MSYKKESLWKILFLKFISNTERDNNVINSWRNEFFTIYKEYKRLATEKQKLGYSIYHGYDKLLENLFLLNPKIEMNFYSKSFSNKMTHAIHIAAIQGHQHIIDILLDRDPNLINMQDCYGFTPLFYACKKGHSHIVKKLLEHDAAIDLMTAEASSDVFKLYHQYGIEMTGSIAGMTIFHIAAKFGQEECMDILLKNWNSKKYAETQLADLLDRQDASKNTTLHYASEQCNIATVGHILNASVKVDLTNLTGQIPLHLAFSRGHYEIATLLINKDQEMVKKLDKDGQSIMHYACKAGNLELIKLAYAHSLPDIPDPMGSDFPQQYLDVPYTLVPTNAQRKEIINFIQQRNPFIKHLIRLDKAYLLFFILSLFFGVGLFFGITFTNNYVMGLVATFSAMLSLYTVGISLILLAKITLQRCFANNTTPGNTADTNNDLKNSHELSSYASLAVTLEQTQDNSEPMIEIIAEEEEILTDKHQSRSHSSNKSPVGNNVEDMPRVDDDFALSTVNRFA